jgi:hypothetical protein
MVVMSTDKDDDNLSMSLACPTRPMDWQEDEGKPHALPLAHLVLDVCDELIG